MPGACRSIAARPGPVFGRTARGDFAAYGPLWRGMENPRQFRRTTGSYVEMHFSTPKCEGLLSGSQVLCDFVSDPVDGVVAVGDFLSDVPVVFGALP